MLTLLNDHQHLNFYSDQQLQPHSCQHTIYQNQLYFQDEDGHKDQQDEALAADVSYGQMDISDEIQSAQVGPFSVTIHYSVYVKIAPCTIYTDCH